mgnify:CR=1 FL=1
MSEWRRIELIEEEQGETLADLSPDPHTLHQDCLLYTSDAADEE